MGNSDDAGSKDIELWFAVLNRAIADFVLYYKHNDVKLRNLGQNAYNWLYIEDEYDRTLTLGSYYFVCSVLDLNPKYIRRNVKVCKTEIRNALIKNPPKDFLTKYCDK